MIRTDALETYGGYYAQDVPVQLINWKKADVVSTCLFARIVVTNGKDSVAIRT